MTLARRAVVFGLVSALSIAIDQSTKVIATSLLQGQPTHVFLGDLFRLSYATNDGAFLSLGARLPDWARFLVLTVGVGGLLVGIAVYAHLSSKVDRTQLIGYSLIVSGGASNWFDRARFNGSVVDFMNLGLGTLRTGIFNVADLAIVAGISVLLVHGWRRDRADKKAAPPVTPSA